MGKPNRKKVRQRRQSKPKQITHLLAFGEGPNPSYAYRVAKEAERLSRNVKVLSVDLQKPNYRVPDKMVFVHGNALKYLEGVTPASVKKAREAYFFQYTGQGKHITTGKQYKRKEAELRSELVLGKGPKAEQFRKNETRYVRLVKRALVPGGQFIIIMSPKSAVPIVRLLQKEGYSVTNRKLTRNEILRSGSPRAMDELSKGRDVMCIKAIKPKSANS